MKNPKMLTEADVGSAISTLPTMIRDVVIVISFAERTLLNTFSMFEIV
jgi:hypothetical protein